MPEFEPSTLWVWTYAAPLATTFIAVAVETSIGQGWTALTLFWSP